MKKLLIIPMLALCTIGVTAQTTTPDVITKHNGETIEGTVLKVEEFTVIFSYKDEAAENTITKYAVDNIKYGNSGRVQNISEKIIINGDQDWDKVVILEDITYIAGLTKVGEVRGKTGIINMHSMNTGDKKSMKKLKIEAAQSGSPFILLQTDKASVGKGSNMWGGSQAVKTGVCYKY